MPFVKLLKPQAAVFYWISLPIGEEHAVDSHIFHQPACPAFEQLAVTGKDTKGLRLAFDLYQLFGQSAKLLRQGVAGLAPAPRDTFLHRLSLFHRSILPSHNFFIYGLLMQA